MLLGVTSGCEGHKGLTETIALLTNIGHSADGITETAASTTGTWFGPHLLTLGTSVAAGLAPHIHTSSLRVAEQTDADTARDNGSLVRDYHSVIHLTSTQSIVPCRHSHG